MAPFRALRSTRFLPLLPQVGHYLGNGRHTTIAAIRDRILVTGTSTTYVVKKLEKRGLIRRGPSARDQRVVIGELTALGVARSSTMCSLRTSSSWSTAPRDCLFQRSAW